MRKYESDVKYTVSDINEHDKASSGITERIAIMMVSAMLFTATLVMLIAGMLAKVPMIVIIIALIAALVSTIALFVTTISRVNYIAHAILDNNLSAAKEKLLGLR